LNAGQLTKTFNLNQNIIKEIKDRYYFYLGNSILDKNIAIDNNAKKYEFLNADGYKTQLIANS
jgi:hypothetical protein